MSERKKFKIQRSPGLELPGLGKPGALEKRNYPPAPNRAIVMPIPCCAHVPFEFNTRQVAEYYAKLGV